MQRLITNITRLALSTSLIACNQGRSPTPAQEPKTGTTPAQESGAATTRPAKSAGQSGIKVRVGRSSTWGEYVTDANGRAVYLLEAESGSGDCIEACLGIWPPVASGPGSPQAEDSLLNPRLLGTRRRPDGFTQATYGGHPLYYYTGDRAPGQTLGHHVEDSWGEWYLVSPAGGEVRATRERREHERRGRDRR